MNVSPISVELHLSTRIDHGRAIAERVALGLGSARPTVEASRRSYDPLWDGPVPEPAQPGDFDAKRPAGASPELAAAAGALRDAVAGLDLLRAAPFDASRNRDSYATVHLAFAERPAGLDRLRPFQGVDGRWTIALSTSTGDLLADPALAPVVDAARSVLAAIRPA